MPAHFVHLHQRYVQLPQTALLRNFNNGHMKVNNLLSYRQRDFLHNRVPLHPHQLWSSYKHLPSLQRGFLWFVRLAFHATSHNGCIVRAGHLISGSLNYHNTPPPLTDPLLPTLLMSITGFTFGLHVDCNILYTTILLGGDVGWCGRWRTLHSTYWWRVSLHYHSGAAFLQTGQNVSFWRLQGVWNDTL